MKKPENVQNHVSKTHQNSQKMSKITLVKPIKILKKTATTRSYIKSYTRSKNPKWDLTVTHPVSYIETQNPTYFGRKTPPISGGKNPRFWRKSAIFNATKAARIFRFFRLLPRPFCFALEKSLISILFFKNSNLRICLFVLGGLVNFILPVFDLCSWYDVS